VAKRSPILGYNHNVRYRGLVFHVQTEDSGVLSPHLFTHLFHHGVIVSTRKLVYDAGAVEEVIKSLMQAQHKAVLKDLKKGVFDDKIDEYLGSTPGLEPRGQQPRRASEPAIEDTSGVMPAAAPAERPPSQPIPTMVNAGPTLPMERPPVPDPRTMTVARGSLPSQVTINMPDPTVQDLDANARTAEIEPIDATQPVEYDSAYDSQPEIEIRLELDDDGDDVPDSGRRRVPHDTAVEMPNPAFPEDRSDGVPLTRKPEPIPPIPSPPERRPGVGAAALPPARPITRPPARPAITPPAVVARPITDRQTSDAVEVYAPAPPSVEPPPGAVERPGAYMQTRGRKDHAIDTLPRSGSAPIPSGLSPLRPASQPPPRRGSDRLAPVGREPPKTPADGVARSRAPTPPRVAPPSGRTPSPNNAGVVMTRPAVIVGAPVKSPTTTRPRKAREDEGRGFGQGLISEKSLDEVILAYLSEDAEDK
jgi:hypothetical protein